MHWARWLQRKNAASREHLIVHYSPLVKFVAGGRCRIAQQRLTRRPRQLRGVRSDRRRRAPDPEARRQVRDVRRPRIEARSTTNCASSTRCRARCCTREVERAFSELEHTLGRSPTDDGLATQLRIDGQELAKWLASIAATTIGPLDRAVAAG